MALDVSYSEQILGAAIFDLSGLPKDYYVSNESTDISWVQTIFQALGLQALLNSSFQLKEFHNALVQGAHFHAIIVRQSTCYVALLLRQNDVLVSEELIQWASQFDPYSLAHDIRFSIM